MNVCTMRLPGSSKVCQAIEIGIMTAIAATCKWCGQEFVSKTKGEKHSKTCRPFACGQCDERLKSKTALQEHMKTHWSQCNLCDRAPFRTVAQLEEHCYMDHDIPIQCTACDKTFKDPYAKERHVRVQHSDNSEFQCPCGLKLQDATKLQQHAEHCVLSKRGATSAIKRKFAELCADTSSGAGNEMEDRNAACTQAFTEVRAEAQKRLECKCSHCGVCFANKDSLKRHIRKTNKGEDGQRQSSSSTGDSVPVCE